MSELSAGGGRGGRLPAACGDTCLAVREPFNTACLSPPLGVKEGTSKSYTSPRASVYACAFVTPS